MNTYYLKMLMFSFLMNILVLHDYENCEKSHYNRSLIPNNTQRKTIKLRLLAQTQNHNPHYHNDPELKEIIDKLNDDAIKKYQQTHDPYKQLKELVEKKGTKLTGGNGAEPMSTTQKELFETYEEMFGHKNDIMLKSGMYPNDNDKSDKSSTCICTDTDNTKLAKTKGKDKYLKHLKEGCTRSICVCSVGSAFLTLIGLIAAKKAAIDYLGSTSSVNIYNIFVGSAAWGRDVVGTVPTLAMNALQPYGIAALVLIILAFVLIILYIWLYRRRKNSWKHECKKHLCK
ncbi:stevor PIR protein, putative [Plasmodium reichenowi]|uniref:Stevor PIR protein, putative n=1 Tax=Plasmodium reichenowi TaxID=5854 RepID=A0A2P9DSQ7_PLARE|nr:stevor PIR protein, putative [Plasmodium reichenowi]